MISFNLHPVTKNLILLNVLVYIITLVGAFQNIPIANILSAHYFNSPLFQPYQVVTHMFVHDLSGLGHLGMNMVGIFIFGNRIEALIGGKKFFFLYVISGLGAIALFNTIGCYEISQLKDQLITEGYDMETMNYYFSSRQFDQIFYLDPTNKITLDDYGMMSLSTMAGASGALFGIMGACLILIPNTQLIIPFIPFPVLIKYLCGLYIVAEIYRSFQVTDDNIAHLAHVGGAIAGIIVIWYWRKFDKKNFY